MSKPITQNDAEDSDKCGPVSHDEARQIVTRFIDSHFNNPGEHARISIPADHRRDDDLRLIAYIAQQRARDAALLAAGLIDPETGEARKVAGPVITTEDGVIVGVDSDLQLFREPVCGDVETRWYFGGCAVNDDFRWYSTREAALSARTQEADRGA